MRSSLYLPVAALALFSAPALAQMSQGPLAAASWDRGGRDGYLRPGREVHDYLTAYDRRLDNGVPFHLYRYAGRAGERVTIHLSSNAFDAYLVLGTPGGRHGIDRALARDDDGGGGLDSRIRFTLPHDGIYVIRVNPVSRGEGRYVLELESNRGWDDRDRWDDRDGGEDERLRGVWELTRTGLRPSPNAGGLGELTLRISADGRYRLRRSGDVDQGRLVRFRPRGADRGERAYLLEGSRDELYLTVRGGEMRLIRRSDERVVAQGRHVDRDDWR